MNLTKYKPVPGSAPHTQDVPSYSVAPNGSGKSAPQARGCSRALSQELLAERAELAWHTVYRTKLGTTPATLDALLQIAHALGVPPGPPAPRRRERLSVRPSTQWTYSAGGCVGGVGWAGPGGGTEGLPSGRSWSDGSR